MNFKPFVAVGGLAAALVVLLVVEYQVATSGTPTLSAATHGISTVGIGASHDSALLPPDDVRARVETILARPLLSPDRRPPPADASSGSAGLTAVPRLTGVLVSPDGKSLIFAGGSNGKSIVIAEGGRIGPYVVKSIRAGEAIVIGPDGLKTLRPAFDTAGAAIPVVRNMPAQVPNISGHLSILEQLRNGPPPSVGITGLSLPPASTPATGPHL